jgi:hypothetical protein
VKSYTTTGSGLFVKAAFASIHTDRLARLKVSRKSGTLIIKTAGLIQEWNPPAPGWEIAYIEDHPLVFTWDEHMTGTADFVELPTRTPHTLDFETGVFT